MQTFVPYGIDFQSSAECLDSLRLNKQILEGRQILNILAGNSRGYSRHPAVLMWQGHESWLYEYLSEMTLEAIHRGIKVDLNWVAIKQIYMDNWAGKPKGPAPSFLFDERVSNSHKYNLWNKDKEHYVEFAMSPNDVCCPDGSNKNRKPCDYRWPTHLTDGRKIK